MIKVRVQNFQSIKNASVDIDGFTVVTGPNNSGKSALMRAIRGVFTNAPGGALVRHGAPHLSVGLEFDDGSSVLWEKGGKINRYTVNGKTLNSVGRGVPPEVEALGIREIRAASERLWPQIAEQFTGSLFLVGRPGSVVAEALSDVDRVGALTEALRLSESDRRSASTELKLRHKDLKTQREEVEVFVGFDAVLETVMTLKAAKQTTEAMGQHVGQAEALATRLKSAREEVASFNGFDEAAMGECDPKGATDIGAETSKAMDACSRLLKALAAVRRWNGVQEGLDVFSAAGKDYAPATAAGRDWRIAGDLHKTLRKTYAEAERLNDLEIPAIPDPKAADKLKRGVVAVEDLERRVMQSADLVARLDIESERLRAEFDATDTEVSLLLGTRGVCPTCGTVCGAPATHFAIGGEA